MLRIANAEIKYDNCGQELDQTGFVNKRNSYLVSVSKVGQQSCDQYMFQRVPGIFH